MLAELPKLEKFVIATQSSRFSQEDGYVDFDCSALRRFKNLRTLKLIEVKMPYTDVLACVANQFDSLLELVLEAEEFSQLEMA